MRLNLVHNPTAGDGQPSAKDLQQMLDETGFQVRYGSTKKDWKKVLSHQADLTVAAGGDGTAAKVLKAAAGSGVPVALLPIGTANNIGRSLGIAGRHLREMAAGWSGGTSRPFDIGVVHFDGAASEERFVEACGGGPFATAIERGKEEVEHGSPFAGNEIDRALSFIRGLLATAPVEPWRVAVDGRDYSGDYIGVEVMNIRFAGPGVPLARDADSGDGLLDVVFMRDKDRPQLIDYLDRRLAHDEIDLPRLKVVRGATVRLEPSSGVLRVDDGLEDDVRGPAEISVRPGAVTLLLPQ
ncbi:MAG: diacylglycerol kinase family protein [Chloroflexota bacterium]